LQLPASNSGTYKIRMTETSNRPPYELSLERIASPSDSATPLIFGQVYQDEINPIGDVDLFYFNCAMGDRVTISFSFTEGQASGEIYNPVGIRIRGFAAGQTPIDCVREGIHTIRIATTGGRGAGRSSYLIGARCEGECPPLPLPSLNVELTGCNPCQVGNTFSAR